MRRKLLHSVGGGVNLFQNASIALSLRSLGINPSKNKIEVFRVANNDVDEFNANQIQNTNNVQSFGGASDLLIRSWYDETDNNNDVNQIDELKMPKIYDGTSGNMILENGKPTILFDGVDDVLTANLSYTIAGDYSFYMIAKLNSIFDYSNIFSYQNLLRIVTAVTFDYKDISIGSGNTKINRYKTTDITSFNQFLLEINKTNTGDYDLLTNNTTQTALSITLGFATPDNLSIGGRFDNAQFLDGNIQEVVILEQSQDTNVTNNINNFYNIY